MKPNKKSDKLLELQDIITKMSLAVCCSVALPELGLRWKEVSRAVRKCRLPMQSGSVARVLCQYLAKSATQDELDGILSRLRLKLVGSQSRTWHVLQLHEAVDEEPAARAEALPQRVLAALRHTTRRAATPEVQSMSTGDLVYLSIQFRSEVKDGAVLYLATPPGQPVALVSYLATDKVLKACVQGLGYSSYTRANLHGSHIPSLLRVAAGGAWCSAGRAPPYEPAPCLTRTGIDYTYRGDQYLNTLIGPDPPLLTELTIKSSCDFFDQSRLNKTINLTLHLKSENVATSLKTWAMKGAIAPDSNFFKIIQKTRSNKILYEKDNSDSE